MVRGRLRPSHTTINSYSYCVLDAYDVAGANTAGFCSKPHIRANLPEIHLSAKLRRLIPCNVPGREVTACCFKGRSGRERSLCDNHRGASPHVRNLFCDVHHSAQTHRACVDDVIEVVENGCGHLGQEHDLQNMGTKMRHETRLSRPVNLRHILCTRDGKLESQECGVPFVGNMKTLLSK